MDGRDVHSQPCVHCRRAHMDLIHCIAMMSRIAHYTTNTMHMDTLVLCVVVLRGSIVKRHEHGP